MVVEDDAGLRLFYRSALQIVGYAVVTAEDGIEALQRIEGNAPDLVVLDMDLPRLHGRDVLAEVRSHADTRQIPVMVVSGADTRDLQGVACVMRKPVTAEVFITTVEKYLRSDRRTGVGARIPLVNRRRVTDNRG